jgi:hypothetical protein
MKNKPKEKKIKPKMKKHKHNDLLLRRNHHTNQNFHVSFVVMITTHKTFLIKKKLLNFLEVIIISLY